MRTRRRSPILLTALLLGGLAPRPAHADDAIVVVGDDRYAREPIPTVSPRPPPHETIDDVAVDPELHRAGARLVVGPAIITSGKGLGYGVGVALDLGTGSVGGRLGAAWLHGEGTNADGTSRPTGDTIGLYQGELSVDVTPRARLHPVIGLGVGVLHVHRADERSGFAGMGTGRLGLDYALGLADADARVGASLTGGLIGPAASEIADLKAYAIADVHLALGF